MAIRKHPKHSGGEYEIKEETKIMHQNVDLQHHYDQEVNRERRRVRKKLVRALAMLAAVYVAAIAAFHAIEGWTWEDSIYFTTSTITTVGSGDLTPHTYYGRLFTIPLMWIGIAVGLYAIYTIQDYGRSELDAVGKHVDNVSERMENLRNGKKK